MKLRVLFVLFFLKFSFLFSQDGVITIRTDSFAKDDRFYKYQITRELFLVEGDTIKTMTFEGLQEAKIITIKKPPGYKYYAYGFLFFTGNPGPVNPGYVTILVGDYYARNPKLWVDANQNFDFTDDSMYTLPYYNERALEFSLYNAHNPRAENKVVFTRTNLFGKLGFRTQMDNYYKFFYPDRKFIGLDYTYREQRYRCKSGVVRNGTDSFRLGLYDGNQNGLYNDKDSDRIVVINFNDTLFDVTNELFTTKIEKKGKTFFEKNGVAYEVIEMDEAGNVIRIKPAQSNELFGRIKKGRKIPAFNMTTYKGEKKSIKRLNRHEVFMYFGSATDKNFEEDTAMLRQIAAVDSCNIRVILFLYVGKSYEMRFFASRARPNYILALGHRDVSKKLGIRSLPQTLLIGKRRKVKEYGISPKTYYGQLQKMPH